MILTWTAICNESQQMWNSRNSMNRPYSNWGVSIIRFYRAVLRQTERSRYENIKTHISYSRCYDAHRF